MADNFNVNDNLYKGKVAEEFKEEPSEEMVPFHEEITICKNEVKEEVYDFEMKIDNIELMNVKEEPIALLENNLNEDNLEVIKSTEHLLSEDFVSGKTFRPFKCIYKNCECAAGQEEFCKCGISKNVATQEFHLKGNVLTKRNGEPKKDKCTDCKYTTHRKDNLGRHTSTHTNDRPFRCTYKNCECTAGQEESCDCDMCEYAATQDVHLKRHILVKHSGKPKNYKCSDCKYTSHRKDQLTQHIRTHANDRPFKCTYKNCECVAEQEEPCKCDFCGYATANRINLNRHILEKHSGKPKRYKCSDCKYTTHRKDNLERHTSTHKNGLNLNYRSDATVICCYKKTRFRRAYQKL